MELKKIWNKIVPFERKERADDVVLSGMDSNGRMYSIRIPTFKPNKNRGDNQ